ncbi:Pycsar system effector family protein [Thalassotalea sp. ND16A]|uniref:Pycsar system effector family protein n=1 Tax=Thalassotalea sp. ND16A TaxID=1535422 RepID=UPI00051A81ED|nr:Pycsar system effector family protein [Thalassotalea sp. ND16A]KGJ99627.1 hypothetical protein ND16A_3727 [Thalassotalea sp. ND16A]
MNQIDLLEKELIRLLFWIRAADSRVSLILPIATAMLAVLAAMTSKITEMNGFGYAVTIIATIALIISIVLIAVASFPRVKASTGSVIFFVGITELTFSEYKQKINHLTEEQYLEDLFNQCYINAQIVNTKFFWVKQSLSFLFLSAPFWLLSIYLLLR